MWGEPPPATEAAVELPVRRFGRRGREKEAAFGESFSSPPKVSTSETMEEFRRTESDLRAPDGGGGGGGGGVRINPTRSNRYNVNGPGGN